MDRTEALLARRDAVVARGVSRLHRLAVRSGKGATLIDADGLEILDFATGIGVMGIGHSQDSVVQAITEQAARLQHICFHVATYEPYVALCEKLVQLFPHGARTKAMLANSGAEAVENAVKIARQATGRPAVICFTEAFHGRTLLGLSLTSKVGTKRGCGPYASELYRLPYPNHFAYGDGLKLDEFVERELARLRHAFVNTVPADQVAAIILEVIQGEGGFNPCPGDYLRGLRQLCDQHGIALIFDEVQSGFGRTGRWAAYEHHGVTPDLSTWAKSLGGGLPISAVLGKAEIMDAALPGTLGGTYGGNPIACASALAAIAVMERERLPERAAILGERIRERLAALASECEFIADVRGMGAMLAMEFAHPGSPRQPASEIVARILPACLAEGLLLLAAGAHSHVLRLLPPLSISFDDLDRGLDILCRQTLAACGSLLGSRA